MDLFSWLPSEDAIAYWLLHYGSFALFGLMAMGIILLPVPEETLMVVAGVLISHDKLEAVPTMLAAYLGSFFGITGSYLIGRTLGRHLLEKYGGWVGVTPKKIQQAHDWFEHYGKWTLIFGYFIPGVRHFTGICAGTSYLEYSQFAFFAYTGAILWVTTFLAIGYFLGDRWEEISLLLLSLTDEIVLAIILIIGLLWLAKIIFTKPKPML